MNKNDSVRTWAEKFAADGGPKKWRWGDAAADQAYFVWSQLAPLFAPDLFRRIGDGETAEERDAAWEEAAHFAQVVGSHTSKSISLPVYGLGDVIRMRDNFHGWTVTVSSPGRPIVLPPYLVERFSSYVGDEGMESYMFEPYGPDNREDFTFGVTSRFDLYAILLCVADQTNPRTP